MKVKNLKLARLIAKLITKLTNKPHRVLITSTGDYYVMVVSL